MHSFLIFCTQICTDFLQNTKNFQFFTNFLNFYEGFFGILFWDSNILKVSVFLSAMSLYLSNLVRNWRSYVTFYAYLAIQIFRVFLNLLNLQLFFLLLFFYGENIYNVSVFMSKISHHLLKSVQNWQSYGTFWNMQYFVPNFFTQMHYFTVETGENGKISSDCI